MDDKILGSEQTPTPGKGTLASETDAGAQKEAAAPASETVDVQAGIYHATKHGGLDTVPTSFDDVNGHWTTIRSANPFEVLYLDYTQYRQITPEMVRKNYDILLSFWSGKSRLMMGGAREKIKARYGEDTVNNAPKQLEAAYHKLKTPEGIELYYKEIEKKRYANGIAAIVELVDLSLDDGELTRNEATRITAKGIDNHLHENEVKEYLLTRMSEAGLKPRSAAQHDNVFENQWMTDTKWNAYRTRQTEWLNITVSTLEQVGEVAFENREKAYQRLANANYLPVVVTRLTNDERGFEFENIINEEKDADKRYLKVVYRLNPSLPFRLGNLRFKSIKDILAMSAGSYSLYTELYHSFQKGHLQIWLAEADAATASLLSAGTSYTDFLRFIFRVSKVHPFYLKEHRFETHHQLAEAAQHQPSLWPLIAGGMYHNELPAWFAGIGHDDWIADYNRQYEVFINLDNHTARDKEMAAVQTLLLVIDKSLPPPHIEAEPAEVKMLDIEGSDQVQYPVVVRLANSGFVKASLQLNPTVPGISLSETELTFHSQNNAVSAQFYVYADGLALVKNKLYSLTIVAKTAYEEIVIPVAIKVVFPKKAYLKQLLKYAAVYGILFAGIRFLLSFLTGYDGWLSNLFSGNFLSPDISEYYLPVGYPFFILTLSLFLASLVASFFIIRKAEKL